MVNLIRLIRRLIKMVLNLPGALFEKVTGEEGIPRFLPDQTYYKRTWNVNNSTVNNNFPTDVHILTLILTNPSAATASILVRKSGGATHFTVELPAHQTIAIGEGAPFLLENSLEVSSAGQINMYMMGYYL